MDEVLLHEINHLMPVYQEYVVQLIKKNDVATLRQLVRDGFEYVAQGAGVSARDVALECGANDVAEFIEQVPALMVSEHVTKTAKLDLQHVHVITHMQHFFSSG